MDSIDLSIDLGLHLSGTHVVITGSSGFIGSATVSAFLAAGANVTALDLRPSSIQRAPSSFFYHNVDITEENSLEAAFDLAHEKFGVVSVCVALASLDVSFLPQHASLTEMSVEQWRRTAEVNVEGTFLTARTWLRQIKAHAKVGETKNVGLIIVGSESGHFGVRGNADYASGKSAVQFGMVQSLTGDVARVFPGARVNAVAPGAVDTPQFRKECDEDPDMFYRAAEATTALRKPVPTSAVAKSILFLASEAWSGNITGHVLDVDSGKKGKVEWVKEEC